jgi:hypothetical protein
MTWHWRRRRLDAEPALPIIEETTRMITTSEEIDRAEEAARLAALHLQDARDRRPAVEAQVQQIRQVNRENGFAALIHRAFGS